MNLILFLYIVSFFTLTLGEFGQFPFASTGFSISATDLLLSLNLGALLIWNIAIKKNLTIPHNFIFLIFFWAICFVSLLFSLDLSGSLYLLRFIIYSSTFYLSFHLIRTGILNPAEFNNLLKITSLVLAIIGLIQLVVFPDLEVLSYLGYDPHKYRVFSTFLDPNFLGTFLSFPFAFLTYELINKDPKNYLRENKNSLICIAILALTILLTFSRSAYLISGISILIILSFKSYKYLLIFLFLAIILYLTFPPFSERIQGAINIDKSAAERFLSWEKGLTIFQQNPALGVGFNNLRNYSLKSNLLKTYSPDGGNSGSGIDSGLIFVLATTGLVGFLAYIFFIIRIFSDQLSVITSKMQSLYKLELEPVRFLKRIWEIPGFRKWYRDRSEFFHKPNPQSLPLFSLTVGLLVNSFFINSLFYPPIMFIWFSALGIFYGLGEGEGEGS